MKRSPSFLVAPAAGAFAGALLLTGGSLARAQEPPTAVAAAPAAAGADPDAPLPTALSIGLAPDVPFVGTAFGAPTPFVPAREEKSEVAGFGFHGFFRTPLRLGLNGAIDPSSTQIHSPAWIPDGTSMREGGLFVPYHNWQYTGQAPAPWTQLNFSYGSPTVRGTVILASSSLSDGAFNNLSANLGINQAYVTIRLPSVIERRLDLEFNVGSFANRYGAMGPTDAGRYETYLIGRTHTAGETTNARVRLGGVDLVLEHGIGAKIDRITDEAKAMANPYLLQRDKVGSTLLHHAHAGVAIARRALISVHYLRSWVSDDAALAGASTPSMTVLAADLRVSSPRWGDFYAAVAQHKLQTAIMLADAVEAFGISNNLELAATYFGRDLTSQPNDEAGADGTITTIGGQYGIDVARALGAERPSVYVAAFGMYQTSRGKTPPSTNTAAVSNDLAKFGGDVTWSARPWAALAVRFDRVMPVVNDSSRSFAVVAPRLVLRTEWLSHEAITIGYSRYFYGASVLGPPIQPDKTELSGAKLDANLVYLAASLWW